MEPSTSGIKGQEIKVPSDTLDAEFNHFDKDDNSDLEDVDHPSMDTTKQQPTVFDYLYNKMRRDIKGIEISMCMIRRECAVDIKY